MNDFEIKLKLTTKKKRVNNQPAFKLLIMQTLFTF